MPWLLNALYLLALAAPLALAALRALTHRQYRRGLRREVLRPAPHPLAGDRRRRSGSTASASAKSTCCARSSPPSAGAIPTGTASSPTTTDTGFDEARKRFPDLAVFYLPFDFSWAVRRALRECGPALVVLAESELWPNFLLAAAAAGRAGRASSTAA